MSKIPRKLTTQVSGSASLLALMAFDVTRLSYFVAVGIIVLSIVSMILHTYVDCRPNNQGVVDGKVHEKVKEILHPKEN